MTSVAPIASDAAVPSGMSQVPRVATHNTTNAKASLFMMIAAVRRKRRKASARPNRCV